MPVSGKHWTNISGLAKYKIRIFHEDMSKTSELLLAVSERWGNFTVRMKSRFTDFFSYFNHINLNL